MHIRFFPFCPTQDHRNFNALQSTRDKCRHVLREEREMTHSSSFLKPISALWKRGFIHTHHTSVSARPHGTPHGLMDPNTSLLRDMNVASHGEGTPVKIRAPSKTSTLVTDHYTFCSSRWSFSPDQSSAFPLPLFPLHTPLWMAAIKKCTKSCSTESMNTWYGHFMLCCFCKCKAVDL